MNRTVLSLLLIVFLGMFVSQSCYAGDGWQFDILISSGNSSNKLTIGQNQTASDDNDGFHDVPALLSGDLHAAFTNGGGLLWRDIRALVDGDVKDWLLDVKSDSGEVITISWDKNRLPVNTRLALVEVDSGQSVDMNMLSSYSMGNLNGGELVIEVSEI